MKNILILVFLLVCTKASGQTNYYTESKIIYGDGFTYKCELSRPGGDVSLHDINSQFANAAWTYKDGTYLPEEFHEGLVEIVKEDNWTRRRCGEIVNEGFTPEQKKMLEDDLISISLGIDQNTGKVFEVYYEFNPSTGFIFIPPDVYFRIAERLKAEIYFVLNPVAKELNFLQIFWIHSVE